MLSISRRIGEAVFIDGIKLTVVETSHEFVIFELSNVTLSELHLDARKRLTSSSPMRFKIFNKERVYLVTSVLLDIVRNNSASTRVRIDAARHIEILREELISAPRMVHDLSGPVALPAYSPSVAIEPYKYKPSSY